MNTVSNSIQGFGCCIYCRQVPEAGEVLTKEHVIPFGLSGNQIILNASCARCAALINLYESRVMRGVLLPIRLHQNTKTRKNTRPTKIKASYKDIKGERKVSLDARNAPFLTGLYRLSIAGYYYNSLPHYHQSIFHWPYPVLNQPLMKTIMGRRSDKEAGYPYKDWSYTTVIRRDEIDFFRMIAKIAYCTVIYYRGLAGFDPFLIPIVTGGSLDINRFIGWPNMSTEQLRELFAPMMPLKRIHNTLVGTREIHGKNVVFCLIKLFADLSVPCYEVLVGLDTNPDR